MPDRSIIGRKPTLLPYHGWLVVAAAFLVALYGFGLGFYGPGFTSWRSRRFTAGPPSNCHRRTHGLALCVEP
jgi:hypothetical protein